MFVRFFVSRTFILLYLGLYSKIVDDILVPRLIGYWTKISTQKKIIIRVKLEE